MTDLDAFVLVPMKSFSGAKRRLGTVLGVSERAELARIMLNDVLGAATAAVGARRVLVVTGDDEVADQVRSTGVGIVDDEGAKGTNAAVKVGFAAIRRSGGGAVAALPADIPGVAATDIMILFAAASRFGIALAPALDDGGTNALVLDRIGRISPCFGPDSFVHHVEAANAAGVRPVVVWNRRLGLDLDKPAHLSAFVGLATATQTDGYLRSLRPAFRRGSGDSNATSLSVFHPRGLTAGMS